MICILNSLQGTGCLLVLEDSYGACCIRLADCLDNINCYRLSCVCMFKA